MRNSGDIAVMVVCGLALLTAMTVAEAQALADPTRPPAALENAAGASESSAAAGAPEAGLQAILRRQGAKPAAVINGRYVELGGKSGDARVVDIGEDTVTLQGANGRETLLLLPGVEKKSADGGDAKKTGKAKTGKGGER